MVSKTTGKPKSSIKKSSTKKSVSKPKKSSIKKSVSKSQISQIRDKIKGFVIKNKIGLGAGALAALVSSGLIVAKYVKKTGKTANNIKVISENLKEKLPEVSVSIDKVNNLIGKIDEISKTEGLEKNTKEMVQNLSNAMGKVNKIVATAVKIPDTVNKSIVELNNSYNAAVLEKIKELENKTEEENRNLDNSEITTKNIPGGWGFGGKLRRKKVLRKK